MLWLVGNGLFDTLLVYEGADIPVLWLVGNGLFDTLDCLTNAFGFAALAGRERPL